MKTFQDFITNEFLDWLDSKSLILKKISNDLYLIYNLNYCIKIYDTIGHGYGVNVNLSKNYNETIYDGDTCSAYWVYKYLGLKEKSNFSSRSLSEYEKNLPLLILDLKNLITGMDNLKDIFWDRALDWIINESHKK